MRIMGMVKRRIFLILLIMLLPAIAHGTESFCPGGGSPNPNVVFCDDFEDGTWLSNPTWEAGFFCPEGGDAVQVGGFNSTYGAYSGNKLYFDGAGYDCKFAGIGLGTTSDEYYFRVYLKFSPGFEWGNTADKGLYFCDAGVEWCVKIEYNQWGSGAPGFSSYQHPGERLFQNQGNDIWWETNKWYLMEFYVKLNTPGVADGIVKMWVDDASVPIGTQTLRLYHANVIHRASGQNTNMGHIRLYEYNNACFEGCPSTRDQWIAWDQVVVSKAPIGPMSPGISDIEPPSITSRSPDSGETNWPVATETVSFTLYDPSGVDSSTLLVDIIPGGTNFSCASNLSCTPSGDPASLSVVYDRGSPWAYSTTYTVDITSVYDTQGNQQSTSWQFTTEAYVPTDTTAPELTSSTPSSGQTGWALNDWQVVFDISDSGNVDDSTLQFNIDGGATQTCGSGLSCSWVIPTTRLQAIYNRGSDWSCGRTYTANIPQVKDAAGNTLNTSWNFYTVACPETGPSGDFIIHIHED